MKNPGKERDNPAEKLNLDEALAYSLEVVQGAGDILRNYFTKLERGKTNGALMAEADQASEEFIRSKIKDNYPQSQFLTEVTPPASYSRVTNPPYFWIADSLDGEMNFSRGDPNFAITICLTVESEVQTAVVHLPQRGRTYWAQADREGVYLNSSQVKVSGTSNTRDMVVALDWPYSPKHRETVARWVDCFYPHVRQIKSRGSAVSDLALVTEGEVDAYVQLGTKPWDTAAGSLFVTKGGGRITTPEGGEWNVFNDRILATNGVLHEPILNMIKEQ